MFCRGTIGYPHRTNNPRVEEDTLMICAMDSHSLPLLLLLLLLLLLPRMDLMQRYNRLGITRMVAPEIFPAVS